MNNLAYLIPDTQSKENVRNPLIPVAHHICHIRPALLLHLGDHWDMPSLSRYDKGKKSHRVRTYFKDVTAGNTAMAQFWRIVHAKWPLVHQQCRSVILKGNHEDRVRRAKEYGPDELIDLIDQFPMDYSHWDEVVPFLKVFTWRGIEFCHYFQNQNCERPIGTARQMLMRAHCSRVAGHKQGFDYEEMPSGADRAIQALIAGSCYYHDEEYKAHTNNHWRGTVIIKNCDDGMFDFARYSLKSLAARYGR